MKNIFTSEQLAEYRQGGSFRGQWFDVLVNGRPEMTLHCETPEAAIREAYRLGLVADVETVFASPRIQDDI